jgi:hypothetical protein
VPVSIEVSLDGLTATISSLEVLPVAVDAEAERALRTSLLLVEAEVKSLTPRKTGRLFSGWETSMRGTTVGIVANRVSYARYIEEGTGPHEIVAKGNALRFTVGGQTIFRKRVQHPGFSGRHMARLGLSIATPKIVAVFREAIKQAIQIALRK